MRDEDRVGIRLGYVPKVVSDVACSMFILGWIGLLISVIALIVRLVWRIQ